jgi:hypothetical protein
MNRREYDGLYDSQPKALEVGKGDTTALANQQACLDTAGIDSYLATTHIHGSRGILGVPNEVPVRLPSKTTLVAEMVIHLRICIVFHEGNYGDGGKE